MVSQVNMHLHGVHMGKSYEITLKVDGNVFDLAANDGFLWFNMLVHTDDAREFHKALNLLLGEDDD